MRWPTGAGRWPNWRAGAVGCMNTNDLFGDYAQGEANAALVKGGTAQVLTKGTVSLALAGAGEGVDLGISFGKFTISRAK